MSLLIAAALMFTGAPETKSTNCSPTCIRRVHRREHRKLHARRSRQCSQTNVIPCIRLAAHRYGISSSLLIRKARCESRLNPYARNASGASGLFQFIPSTFASTPYARRDIFSARYSSLAAAWMHKQGRGGEWVCQ